MRGEKTSGGFSWFVLPDRQHGRQQANGCPRLERSTAHLHICPPFSICSMDLGLVPGSAVGFRQTCAASPCASGRITTLRTQHHDREVGKPLQFTRILSTCYAHRPVNRCSASSASSPLGVQLASNQPLTSLPPPSGIFSDW